MQGDTEHAGGQLQGAAPPYVSLPFCPPSCPPLCCPSCLKPPAGRREHLRVHIATSPNWIADQYHNID